jgi:hypothetical protein
MSVAAVMTVRNEDDILSENIRYHRYLGVERFYVFLDQGDDPSANSISADSAVTLHLSTIPSLIKYDAVHQGAIQRWFSHHTARQIVNCLHAAHQARQHGIQWLLNIDPDELVCVEDHQTRQYALSDLLMSLPSSVGTVTFPTWEVVPQRVEYCSVFSEATLFKTPYGFGEGRRFERDIGFAKSIRRWADIFYKFREHLPEITSYPARLRETAHLLDVPHMCIGSLDGETVLVIDWYLGHFIGKQAFRISDNIEIRNLHRLSLPPNAVNYTTGKLLHYNNYSAAKFLKKYKSFASHPSYYKEAAPVDPAKLLLRDIVNSGQFEERDLQRLYANTFVFAGRRLDIINERWKAASCRITGVADWFRSRV